MVGTLKKKTKKKAVNAKAKAKAKAVATKAVARRDSKVVTLVMSTLAKLPALDDEDRSAFAAQASDATCDELGVHTRGAGVLTDAGAWVPIIATALGTKSAALKYSSKRFAFYCECVLALHDAVDAASGNVTATGTVTRAAEIARRAARDVHKTLAAALVDLAGEDADLRAEIAAARSPNESDDDLKASLDKLAAIGERLVASSSAALLEDVGLDAALLADVSAKASSLVATTASKSEAGSAARADPASVNRVEGRVLFEMRTVFHRFAAANEKDRAVKRLVPGSNTRSMIDRRRGASAADPPDDPTAGGASTSTAPAKTSG